MASIRPTDSPPNDKNRVGVLPAAVSSISLTEALSRELIFAYLYAELDGEDLLRRQEIIEKGLPELLHAEERGFTSPSDPSDPNVVDWASPEDPEKALNWPAKKKWANIAVISSITFLTPLASSMPAPSIPDLMREFNSTNQTIAVFVISVYILGYAIGPLVIAPLSELYGRLIVYHCCNVLFIIFTVACALAPNMSSLIFFRFMAGCAGSAPLTIGGGSITDMVVQEKRGGATAVFVFGPLLGPVIGPVAGGYLAEAKGWRWVFWIIAIAVSTDCCQQKPVSLLIPIKAGALTVIAFILMRETYEATLLGRRAAHLRKESNNPNLRSKFETAGRKHRETFMRAIIRPTKMLLFSPIVFSLSLYMAVVYGYLYLLFTTMTQIFQQQYGFSAGNVGLTFLGIGVGCLLGLAIFGLVSDPMVKKMSRKGEMKPEYRLPPLIPSSLFIPMGLFWYGWTAEKAEHWILPILGTMFIGIGFLATFLSISLYLVDAFPIHAASAIAANTVLRSLAGAFLPLAGPSMYASLGLGWGNSLLAFIALALSPLTWVFFRYGERIRKHRRFQLDLL
jgi:multidrug resistance protein